MDIQTSLLIISSLFIVSFTMMKLFKQDEQPNIIYDLDKFKRDRNKLLDASQIEFIENFKKRNNVID